MIPYPHRRVAADAQTVRFVSADQVIEYTDLLVLNTLCATEGDALRALVAAVQTTEMAIVAGARPDEYLPGGVPFLTGVLVLLRDRLRREVSEQVDAAVLLLGE